MYRNPNIRKATNDLNKRQASKANAAAVVVVAVMQGATAAGAFKINRGAKTQPNSATSGRQ